MSNGPKMKSNDIIGLKSQYLERTSSQHFITWILYHAQGISFTMLGSIEQEVAFSLRLMVEPIITQIMFLP